MVFDSKEFTDLDTRLYNQKRLVIDAFDNYKTLLTHINPILAIESDNTQCLSLKSDCKKILKQEIIVLNNAYESVRPFLKNNQPELYVTVDYDENIHTPFFPIQNRDYKLEISAAITSLDFLYDSYIRIINNLSPSHPLSLMISDIDKIASREREEIADKIALSEANLNINYVLPEFSGLALVPGSHGFKDGMSTKTLEVYTDYAIEKRPVVHNFAMECLKDMKNKLSDFGYMPPIYHFKLEGYTLPEQSKR